MYSYGYTPFCFTNFKNSLLNSCDKCLKSLSNKSSTNAFNVEFINFMLSIKTKILLIVKATYFSNQFGTKLIFRSNLPIPCIMK